jgi:hypothetical protein
MSGTRPPGYVPAPATGKDRLIADAKSLPDLIAKAQLVDPAFATSLTAKPLLASRSPAGTLLAGVVAWLAGRYGLGWDDMTCNLVAGVGVLLGGYAMRSITSSPIKGIISAAPAKPPEATP